MSPMSLFSNNFVQGALFSNNFVQGTVSVREFENAIEIWMRKNLRKPLTLKVHDVVHAKKAPEVRLAKTTSTMASSMVRLEM
jgi:hypothetical protein